MLLQGNTLMQLSLELFQQQKLKISLEKNMFLIILLKTLIAGTS